MEEKTCEETETTKKKKKKGQDKMPCANPFQGAFVKEIIYI